MNTQNDYYLLEQFLLLAATPPISPFIFKNLGGLRN
jgi:hypothetical protein